MSYILDALKRADSERERGKVPSLHANPTPADRVDGDDDLGGTSARPWPLLAAGLGLGLLGVLAWQYLTPRKAPPAPSPPAPMATAAVAPPTAAPPATAQPAPIAAPMQPPMPASAPVAVATPLTPAPVARPAPTAPPPIAARSVPAAAPAVAPVAPAAAPPEARVFALAELPEATRRQLPPLTAGGAMYSDAPSQRMLIINGQVLREGDRVAADLVLERIELKSAVLAFKGQRLRISY